MWRAPCGADASVSETDYSLCPVVFMAWHINNYCQLLSTFYYEGTVVDGMIVHSICCLSTRVLSVGGLSFLLCWHQVWTLGFPRLIKCWRKWCVPCLSRCFKFHLVVLPVALFLLSWNQPALAGAGPRTMEPSNWVPEWWSRAEANPRLTFNVSEK